MYDQSKLNELAQARDKWEETTLHQTLSRMPERADKFITASGCTKRSLFSIVMQRRR